MAGGQNIIELGFDVDKITAEQAVVINGLNKVYEAAKKIDGIKLSFGNADGFGAFQKAITEQNKSTETITKSVKDYEKTLKDVHKTIISNSADEIKAWEQSRRGMDHMKTAVNETEAAYHKAASAAAAVTTANKKLDTGMKQTNETIKSTQKSIETLTGKLEFYKEMASTTTDPTKLKAYNQQIQQTSIEISRLKNVGKTGFDELGNAIGRSKNMLSQGLAFLMRWAYILPGIGIAGIIAFATEPIINYVKSLDMFKKKLSEAEQSQQEMNKALESSSYTDAIKNVSELTINIQLAKKGLLDKADVLRMYNDTIGKTTGEVKNLDTAEIELIKNGDDYIQMTLMKASAQLALEDAAKKAYEAARIRAKGDVESANWFDKLISSMGSQGNSLGMGGNWDKYATGVHESGAKRREANASEADKDMKQLVDIATKFQTIAAEIATRHGWDMFPDPEGKKAPKGKKKKDPMKEFFEQAVKDAQTQLELRKKMMDMEVQLKEDMLKQLDGIEGKYQKEWIAKIEAFSKAMEEGKRY